MGNGFVIGLTGGLGTGKTTVSSILQKLGLKVVNADEIGHQMLKPGTEVYRKVKAAFGPEILSADGQIDRKALGKLIFANPVHRQLLNDLAHPAIKARLKAEVYELKNRGEDVVVEIPLLFETKMEKKSETGLDQIWVVAASPATQLRRVMARDGIGAEEAQRRIETQMPLVEKIARADVVIYNDGNEDDLKVEVARLLTVGKESHNSPPRA